MVKVYIKNNMSIHLIFLFCTFINFDLKCNQIFIKSWFEMVTCVTRTSHLRYVILKIKCYKTLAWILNLTFAWVFYYVFVITIAWILKIMYFKLCAWFHFWLCCVYLWILFCVYIMFVLILFPVFKCMDKIIIQNFKC